MRNLNADVRLFNDGDGQNRAATNLIIKLATEAIHERGCFKVALSGGGTPAGLYRMLAKDPFRNKVDWQNSFVFWGDERCVPPDDPSSNYRQAMDVFLSQVPIPKENILRIKGELEPAEAAKAYTKSLKQFATPPLDWPRFDLVLLGMGADGHTASLFPGSPVDVSTPTIAVTADYQGRPAQRVTLTPTVFNTAKHVIFLVSGVSKSAVLARVLNGDYNPMKLPAQRIRPTEGILTWFVDQAAASKLDERSTT